MFSPQDGYEYKAFDKTVINDMIHMATEEAVIAGAFRVRLQHLCMDDVEFNYQGRIISPTLKLAFSEHWTKFLYSINSWLEVFGLVC